MSTTHPSASESGLNLDHLEALAPCPFCGGTNIDPAEWSGNDGAAGPGCGDCGALADSAEAWNRRAAPVSSPIAGAIKTWRQRQAESIGAFAPMHYADAEIADLRAALANQPAPTAAPEQADERALFEADTLELYPAATFGRFPSSGNYNVSWVQEQWGGWQRRAKLPQPSEAAPLDIETAAKAIYALLPPCQGVTAKDYPWQPGGNSMKQEEARDYARAALEAVAAPSLPAAAPAPTTVDVLRDLSVHEDMADNETAAILGMGLNAVRKEYFNAREDLRGWKRRALTAEASLAHQPAQEQAGQAVAANRDAARYRYLATLIDWSDIERACWSTTAKSAVEFKRGLDKYIDARLLDQAAQHKAPKVRGMMSATSPLVMAHRAAQHEAGDHEKASAYDELNRQAELSGFASAAAAIVAARGAASPVVRAQSEESAAELCIGFANNDQGAHVSVMQRHVDGSVTVVHQAKVPSGDSTARFTVAATTDQATAALKDHEVAQLVNKLRDIAIKYHAAGQLRSQIQNAVAPLVDRVKCAERERDLARATCREFSAALADAGAQQPHAGADEVARLMIEHRIAVTPEYEGQWHAAIYRDQELVMASGEGSTPRAAVDAAIRAAQEGGAA